nr:RNA-directed DNA polymerase, eukaryota, reverse transcriptase zinc-binding domain protein [Tanacetum cinerariifolium]
MHCFTNQNKGHKILSVIRLTIDNQFGYGYLKEIVVRRADMKEYTFREAEFSRLYLNDIEDMFLLYVQHKIHNLTSVEIVALELILPIKILKEKSKAGDASFDDRKTRLKLLQELDKLKNLESLDTIQKARIKWDMDGDENPKKFHGLVNEKRRTQSIHGVIHEGIWILEHQQVKDAFLNFFKMKFQANHSMVDFPSLITTSGLHPVDCDSLKLSVSFNEVKKAVWDYGSEKSLGPDGFSFAFVNKFWDLLKLDLLKFMNYFLIPLSSYRRLTPHSSLLFQSLTSEFSLKHGFRQWDPLSPFIFILVMEVVYVALLNAVTSSLVHGVKLGFHEMNISYLFYVDDVVITTN